MRRLMIGLAGVVGVLTVAIVNFAWGVVNLIPCGVDGCAPGSPGAIHKEFEQSAQEWIFAGTTAVSLFVVVFAVARQKWSPLLILQGVLLTAMFLPWLLSL